MLVIFTNALLEFRNIENFSAHDYFLAYFILKAITKNIG